MGVAGAAAVVSAVVAAAGTGYSVYAGERANDLAEEQYDEQMQMQQSQIAKAESREQEAAQAQAEEFRRDQARRRQQAIAWTGNSRYGTLVSGYSEGGAGTLG